MFSCFKDIQNHDQSITRVLGGYSDDGPHGTSEVDPLQDTTTMDLQYILVILFFLLSVVTD